MNRLLSEDNPPRSRIGDQYANRRSLDERFQPLAFRFVEFQEAASLGGEFSDPSLGQLDGRHVLKLDDGSGDLATRIPDRRRAAQDRHTGLTGQDHQVRFAADELPRQRATERESLPG
jgi:hypothetical protein